jgi:hypothetical protein
MATGANRLKRLFIGNFLEFRFGFQSDQSIFSIDKNQSMKQND